MDADRKNGPYQRPRMVDHVTIQGMSQINDANSGLPRRLLWITILLGGLLFTAFNIAQQIQLYRSGPISVNIDIKLAEKLLFPTITICNTNGLKKSTIELLNITEEVKIVYAYVFEKLEETYNRTGIDLSKVRGLNFTRESGELTHTANDSLLWCTWEGYECNLENFTQVLTDIGMCFSFNGTCVLYFSGGRRALYLMPPEGGTHFMVNGTLPVRNSGRLYGLHLSLNAMSEEFLRSLDQTEGHGFLVAVHAHNVPPLMNELGVAVYPGSHYFFGLDVLEVTAPDGLGNCGNKKLKLYESNYSREACRIECFTEYVVQHCSCKEASMPSNVTTCTPAEMVECFNPTRIKYLRNKSECESSCPQTCSYKEFNVKSSSNLMLTDEYLQTLGEKTNRSRQYWKENYIAIDIYMTSMSYQSIQKRYSYSVLDLFCDIGGALGLALGASILTFVECVDFCIRCIEAYWGFKTVKNMDPTSKQSESDLPKF